MANGIVMEFAVMGAFGDDTLYLVGAVLYVADFEQLTIYTGLHHFIVASHIRRYDGYACAQCFD